MDNSKTSNPVKARMKEFVASLGISEREFCRRIGVSSGYIESIKQSISPKVMQIITMHYPDLNPMWLILGKGEMLKSETVAKENAQQSVSVGGGLLPSEMLVELLKETREEKAKLYAANERLTGVVESQQRTINLLTNELKKANAQQGDDATCAAVG